MRFLLPCCACFLLLLSSCSEARLARYDTRYLPPAYSLDYDGDLREFPANPPALDGEFKGTSEPTLARPRIRDDMTAGREPMPNAGKSYRKFE